MKRLNDTAALAASPPSGNIEHSLNVRAISNGFVTRSSTCNPQTGEYKSSEVFSKNAPRIVPARVANQVSGGDGASGGLADTMAYLEQKQDRT